MIPAIFLIPTYLAGLLTPIGVIATMWAWHGWQDRRRLRGYRERVG